MQRTEVDDDEDALDAALQVLVAGSAQGRQHRQQKQRPSEKIRDSDDLTNKCSNNLLYIGKLDLPHHPVRMRYLPYSTKRYLLCGQNGYQEMKPFEPPEPPFYSLQEISWETRICDCVQTSDLLLYVIARCRNSAVLACYDQLMLAQDVVEVRYPLGCLSSITTNASCTYLYGTNHQLNCVTRFARSDLGLAKAERFGSLWRPFDCCTSQEFSGGEGGTQPVQFLFVSNFDAGICVFNMNSMEIVTECGDDLSPGAKYLAYDPNRSLLFVSSSCDRLLRCYKFQFESTLSFQKIGDFLIATRPEGVAYCGPQCVMWDAAMNHLTVIGWSRSKGRFRIRVFQVNT